MMKFLRRLRNSSRTAAVLSRPAILVAFTALLFAPACEDSKPTYPDAPVTGTLIIENDSQYTVDILRFRPAGTDQWGVNYLVEPLESGFYVPYFMPVGNFDIRLENKEATAMWTFSNVAIQKDQEYTITAQ